MTFCAPFLSTLIKKTRLGTPVLASLSKGMTLRKKGMFVVQQMEKKTMQSFIVWCFSEMPKTMYYPRGKSKRKRRRNILAYSNAVDCRNLET